MSKEIKGILCGDCGGKLVSGTVLSHIKDNHYELWRWIQKKNKEASEAAGYRFEYEERATQTTEKVS